MTEIELNVFAVYPSEPIMWSIFFNETMGKNPTVFQLYNWKEEKPLGILLRTLIKNPTKELKDSVRHVTGCFGNFDARWAAEEKLNRGCSLNLEFLRYSHRLTHGILVEKYFF